MKKKGFFVIFILLVVAVVLTIVFINLFREKDTGALVRNVHSTVTNGYLNKDDDKNKKIDEYLTQLATLGDLSDAQRNQVSNYLSAYAAFETFGDFFDREIVFTQYTNEYKNNRGAIENDFSKAQNAVDGLYGYLEVNKTSIGNSDFWVATSWNDCDDYMADIFNYTVDAINRLADVYQSSATSNLMRNDFTQVLFMATENLFAETTEKLTTDASAGRQVYTFVRRYFSEDGVNYILNYNYNDSLQGKVFKILENGTVAAEYQNLLDGSIVA
ncbi:MAG: hypothetical protein J6K39_03740 [Clostridia bacterium]|nr:hypothetical protein [Clostridia bacterium]